MVRMVLLLAVLVLAVPIIAGAAPEPVGGAGAQAAASSPPVTAETAGQPRFFSWAYWQQGGSNTSRSEIFRNFGLLAVAVIGLCFGVWRAVTSHRQANTAHRQANVAEQGHFTDRFFTAAKHLGSEQLPVRLGGIYALWRLTQDSPRRDVISVIDILCAFVRIPPHERANPTRVRADVQAVMNLIGDNDVGYCRHLLAGYRPNLRSAKLPIADLREVALMDADLTRADLTSANLTDADLTGARLLFATLRGADLTRTNLTDGNISFADLTDADLTGTILTGTILTHANLTGAKNLTQAQLEAVRFEPNRRPSLPRGLVLPEPPPHAGRPAG